MKFKKNMLCSTLIRHCLIVSICLFIIACGNDNTEQQDSTVTTYNFNSSNHQTLHNISDISNQPKTVIPSDIEAYMARYANFVQTLGLKNKPNIIKIQDTSNKEALALDKDFIFLRQKYHDDSKILQILSAYQCFIPDCSAIIQDTEYFYPNMTILEAYQTIIMDKYTKVLNNIDVIHEYDYVLKNKQTTTIDLQSQATLQNKKTQPYQYVKFAWENPNRLIITLSPKEEICLPYHYNSITTFIQETNGVRTKRYEKKLPTFSYPADLVQFVAQSCACAMGMGNISHIIPENLDDLSKGNLIKPDTQYCDLLDSKRKELWEKYMQDSRIITILQHEQKMYRAEYSPIVDIDSISIESQLSTQQISPNN